MGIDNVLKIHKIKRLEEQMEFHHNNILHLKHTSQTYKQGAEMIRQYAIEHKELTGQWYTKRWRDWNGN